MDHSISYDVDGNMHLEDVPGCRSIDDEIRNSTITRSFGPIAFTDNQKMVVDLEYFTTKDNGYFSLFMNEGKILLSSYDNNKSLNTTKFFIDEKGRPYYEQTNNVFVDEIK